MTPAYPWERTPVKQAVIDQYHAGRRHRRIMRFIRALRLAARYGHRVIDDAMEPNGELVRVYGPTTTAGIREDAEVGVRVAYMIAGCIDGNILRGPLTRKEKKQFLAEMKNRELLAEVLAPVVIADG